MKKFCVFFSLFIGISGYAQKMNKLGKIVIDELPKAPDYWVIKNGYNYKMVYKDSIYLEGNVYYKLPNAIIASEETADDRPDKINYYDTTGRLIVSVISPRIINLKISEKGNYAAFYNQKNIIKINLTNFSLDTLFGSYSYAFTNDEKLVYYDSEERVVVYENHVYSFEDFPIMFLDYNSTILVFTSEKILKLTDSGFVPVREFHGSFYDAMIINQILYFVDKSVKRNNITYRLYKTIDLVNYSIVEISDYE